MSFSKLLDYKIILASQSPRRSYLLKELGLNFEVKAKEVNEEFSEALKREEIPLFLVKLKANAYQQALRKNEILLTADTIVWVEGKVLNKPKDYVEAVNMLKTLSGKKHEVITAVNLKSEKREKSFFVVTQVYFKQLLDAEIDFYVKTYQPFDKAGAYGAQEWIGYIGVERIEGSYFNVMGLPVKEVYEELIQLISS